MKNTDRSLSKFLSFVLRHNPASIGIELDSAGWTDIDVLLTHAHDHGTRISRDDLTRIVNESDKQRFAISDNGRRIRANQGHSVTVDLDLIPQTPPEILYHGTVARFLDSISSQGLLKGGRHHVHLSANEQTANQVGSRRGKPVVLQVAAANMHAAGHVFYCTANGVWLTEHVPPEFLNALADDRSRPAGLQEFPKA